MSKAGNAERRKGAKTLAKTVNGLELRADEGHGED